MKTPIITIHTGANASLDSFYESIRAGLDARYHQPGNSFPTYTLSDKEIGEIESLSSYAAHAGDHVIIDGNKASLDGGRTWTPIERLIS